MAQIMYDTLQENLVMHIIAHAAAKTCKEVLRITDYTNNTHAHIHQSIYIYTC